MPKISSTAPVRNSASVPISKSVEATNATPYILQAGAFGYLLKEAPQQDLVAGLHRVAQGGLGGG